VFRDGKEEKQDAHKESEKDAGDEVRKDEKRKAREDEPSLALTLAIQKVGATDYAEEDAEEEFHEWDLWLPSVCQD
jgi:hypothetical protein